MTFFTETKTINICVEPQVTKRESLDTSSSLTSIYMTQLKAPQSVELAQKQA